MLTDNFSRSDQFGEINLTLAGESVVLSAQRYVWWPAARTLFVADCHFGKVAHFRKSGIGIPQGAGNQTFTDMHDILCRLQPVQVIFLGDLFHSHYNPDFDRFAIWRRQFQHIQFQLVLGNHDVIQQTALEEIGLSVFRSFTTGPFFCTHYPDFQPEIGFNLSGHLHPGVHITGLGRQSVRAACFWKTPSALVLPAFGSFTGSAIIKPEGDHELYVVAGTRLFYLHGSLVC